jgi:hypothetical protein
VAADGTTQGPLVAGGFSAFPAAPELTFEAIDPVTGLSLGNTTFFSPAAEQQRAGATATWFSANRALIFGGNLGSPAGMEAAQVGILLAGFPAAETSSQMTLDVTSAAPVPRSGHTATSVGPDELLLAGGFLVQAGVAIDAAVPFAQRVTLLGGGPSPSALFQDVTGGAAVGYHDAIATGPGVALIAGGVGTGGASGSAYRYEAGALAQVASPMVVARFGHRLTALADGTILVTGGLTSLTAPSFTVDDVELFNPKSADDDERGPGVAGGQADGSPYPLCPVVD